MSKRSHSAITGLRSGLQQDINTLPQHKYLLNDSKSQSIQNLDADNSNTIREIDIKDNIEDHHKFEIEERSETGTISKLRIGRKDQSCILQESNFTHQYLRNETIYQPLNFMQQIKLKQDISYIAKTLLHEMKSAKEILNQELYQGIKQEDSIHAMIQELTVENPIIHSLALLLDRLQTNYLDYLNLVRSRIQQAKAHINSLLLKKKEQLENIQSKKKSSPNDSLAQLRILLSNQCDMYKYYHQTQKDPKLYIFKLSDLAYMIEIHDRNNLKQEYQILWSVGQFVKRIECDKLKCKHHTDLEKLPKLKEKVIAYVEKQMQSAPKEKIQRQIQDEFQLIRRQCAINGNKWMYMSNFGDPSSPHPIRSIYSQMTALNRMFKDDITDTKLSKEAFHHLFVDSYLFRNYIDIKGYSHRYYNTKSSLTEPIKVMIYVDQ
eukprot:403367154